MYRLRKVWITLAICAIVTGVLLGIRNHYRSRPLPFDSTTWKNAVDPPRYIYDWHLRGRMAGDLVESQMLLGLTRAEVEELLGPPEQVFEHDSIRYQIGHARDSAWGRRVSHLDMLLDEEEKVRLVEFR